MRPLPAWQAGHLASCLRSAGVIAYPTEGVWGLGCLPGSFDAVSKILGLKKRSWREGLILVAGSIEQLGSYLDNLSNRELEILGEYWPGPTTFLVPDNGIAPGWIVGANDTLAVRVSEHPVVRFLCDAVDGPLVSTSANISGRPAAKTALAVRRYFGDKVDYIVPGDLGVAAGASAIRVLATGEIVRGTA